MSSSPQTTVVHPRRRHVELLMLLLAQGIGLAAFFLTSLNRDGVLPAGWQVTTGLWIGLGLLAHVVVRIVAPYADPLLLPCAILLNGLGLAMIQRLTLAMERPVPKAGLLRITPAQMQMLWTVLAIIAFAVTLVVVRRVERFRAYPYLLFLVGLILLLLPLVPGVGVSMYGARIWIRIAGFSIQPGEFAKIALTMAFAGYLVEKGDVLALAGRRFLGIDWPRARDLGPILIMWVAAVLVLVLETDLGSSLLFFGLFLVMLYVATQRAGWPILGVVMFAVAAVLSFSLFGHVRRRVNAWLDPWSDYQKNYQIIQGQFGMDFGGLLGRGWGLGSPWMTPVAKSDMIATAITEEAGLATLIALIVVYGIMVARGLRAALSSQDGFAKLVAMGLSFTYAIQVFVILGGVTRLLPLTGLTTPFVSQGGSAIVANYMIVAILLVISHQARRPRTLLASALPDDDRTQVISA